MIKVNLTVLLAERGLSVGDFASQVGITSANISVLKNGHASAIRFSTLEAICRVLYCQPGDILEFIDDGPGARDR